MAAGRKVETAELVVSLRTFIREVLDLDAVPLDVAIPKQGPARPGTGARGAGDRRESGSGTRGGGRGGGAMSGGAGGLAMGADNANVAGPERAE